MENGTIPLDLLNHPEAVIYRRTLRVNSSVV
jgi:hypothetical protein